MSTCSGCNPDINCPEDQDTVFPYSLTPGSPFPYVINCPEGVNCSEALEITMNCCGSPVTATIPAGASADERAAIVQQLVAQCSFIESGCANPPSGTPPFPPGQPIPPGTQLYFSHRTTANIECSATYGGGTYSFIVEAGRFIGLTQAIVDAQVREFARTRALAQRFCLSAPCLCPCADEAATLNINTVRGTGPFSYEITSGSLPTGLTLTVIGGVLRVAGTPTTEGNSTITIRVYDSLGGWLTKNLTFYVIGITTSSPLPDYTAGEEYSQQLAVTGGIGPFAWSVLSGTLPVGLTLSDEGLISGTPTGSGEATFEVIAVDTGLTGHQGCSKEFTLDQNAAPVLYFTMDNFVNDGGTDYMVDDAATPPSVYVDIPATVGGLSVVAGKISTAVQMISGQAPIALPRTRTLLSDGFGFEDLLNLSGKSWTIRMWIKNLANLFDEDWFTLFIADIDREYGVKLTRLQISGEFPDMRYQVAVDNGDFSSPDISLYSPIIAPAVWQVFHRVVIVYDATAEMLKIKINNDAFVTQAAPGAYVMSSLSRALWAFPYNGGTNKGYVLDELCVINGEAWDDGDCTYDWNSGSGRTYPDLP